MASEPKLDVAAMKTVVDACSSMHTLSDSFFLHAAHEILDANERLHTKEDKRFLSVAEGLIIHWSNTYAVENDIQRHALVDLSVDMTHFHRQILADRELHKTDGHLFNILSLWNRLSGLGETLHSRLLHFLLSPDVLHGQGYRFLFEFLLLAGVDNPQKGKWIVTAEESCCESRVDVLLKRHHPHSVIVIENKSNWATDQANQLYRYWYRQIHTCRADCDPSYYRDRNDLRIIYLSPSENKAYSEQTCRKPLYDPTLFDSKAEYDYLPEQIPLKPELWTFDNQIQQWIERCMELLNESNIPLKNYLHQYKEYCKTL